ncbi:gliding motility-associated-like protein [Chryseobacterium sp. CBTAP 102]|uniref:Gliding motility-associated C-terminal domain-containing protein n=2 Tax=Chryseobacterium group TaxID=2782232 RepID=A0ABY2R875_9FLAO|nr:gliding motility-associated-like protein [Chryseobacterium sp. CBTAP 102]THV61804.1 gliding motility-associated C-terminal domain-containing protein [Chryseobacterium candidae]SIQ55934.1 gliding motility-associated C-terminal domain-containing protein [Chryseobacterium sp. RU33C]
MRRYLPLCLFFLVISNFLFSQTPLPRKSIKEPSTPMSRRAGAFIDVNAPSYAESSYTIEKMVKDVLISSGTNTCLTPNVTNVKITPNHAASDANRAWGYFHKATTNFPFKDGLILSTGYARKAGNSLESNTLSDNNGGGSDADLAQVIGVVESRLNDAVLLEFDFVPTTSQIKFNYLIASEEYTGSFPCTFADAFAILLKPTSGGPYVNMAVLPGGAGPVSITNIHPAIGSSCGAVNEQYFAGYNTGNVETNFQGRTIPLTATATVVAGQQYHFKMVIADYSDHSYDSAVFLEGGSFNIGVDLLDPAGTKLPSDINVCDNVPQVITASVNDPNLVYQWYYNGAPVPNATTNTITAIQPGTYTIEVSVPGNPCPGKASIQIHGGTTPQAQDATLLLCTTPDITTFDLSTIMPAISPTPGAIFKFYENQADAVAQNNNYIQTPLNYNGNDGQILYVLVSNGGFCSKIVELTLQKEATPTAKVKASRIKICPGESVTLTAEGGDTYLWSNFMGTGNMQTVTLYQTTTFTVYALGAKGCKSLNPATIRIEVTPEITSTLKDVEMCVGDVVTLDAGAGDGYKYLWSTGATTQKINVNQWGIYSVEIDNGICKKVFEAKVMGAATPFVTALNYESIKKTVTITAENPPMNNTPSTLEYSLDGGITWQDSNVFANLLDNTNYTVLVRRVGTHCVGSLEFFTLQINNIITPNEDGINDVLDLKALGDFKNFTGSIYDRYGVEMFRFSKENPVWDGTVGGKRLPTATYWYKFNFEYPKSKAQMNWSGWIMLKNRN